MLMEDVQDGIKASIQNGVTEDPEFEESLIVVHKSFGGVIYTTTEISNPEIQSEVRGEVGRTALTGIILCSVAGVVT